MEVSRLEADCKFLGINGVTFNIEERCRLDLACTQLQTDIQASKIFLWGKVRGK